MRSSPYEDLDDLERDLRFDLSVAQLPSDVLKKVCSKK
jgi:hypothetical protein